MSLPNAPESRMEQYLSVMAGEGTSLPAAPQSRIEQYLEYICEHGSGGGGTGKVTEGYLYNGNFYSDAAHTTLITPVQGCLYVDKTNNTGVLYYYNGSAYVGLGGGTATTDKFLSGWNSASGQPISFPHQTPYLYETGMHFKVAQVATGGYTHSVAMTGAYETYVNFDIAFAITTESGTQFATLEDIKTALTNAGHISRATQLTATGTMESGGTTENITGIYCTNNVLFVVADRQNLPCTTITTITDTVTTLPTTNYKPSGSSYTGAASTTVETGRVMVGDFYFYDGTTWILLVNTEHIRDVKNADGTSLVDGNGDANIPKANSTTFGVIKTWEGTQAQYDAITTKDSDTYYFITE